LLRPASQRDYRYDRADADDDAEHREERAKLVRAESAERYANRFAEQHPSSFLLAAAGTSAAPASTTTPGATGTARATRGRCRLLQSTARTGTHSRLLRITLRLEQWSREENHLFANGYPAQYLSVIEVADSNAHQSRLVLVAVLDEHHLRLSAAKTRTARTSAARASGTASTTKLRARSRTRGSTTRKSRGVSWRAPAKTRRRRARTAPKPTASGRIESSAATRRRRGSRSTSTATAR
jgi:hypothetical protein